MTAAIIIVNFSVPTIGTGIATETAELRISYARQIVLVSHNVYLS